MGGKVLEYESKTLWRNAKVEGKAEGKAEAVLELLEELGKIPWDLQERIEAENDMMHLTCWLKLASRAGSIEEFREKAGI